MLDVDAIELARHVCLLALAVVCVYTDLARGRLYNVVTIGGLLVGLAIAYLLDAASPGYVNLRGALLAAALGGGVFFALYLTGGMGAGDVKLMAAVGALGATWRFAVLALVYTALVGAVIALGVLIWKGRVLQGLKDSARTLFTFRGGKRDGKAPTHIPYGVAIGIGTIWAWMEVCVL